MSVRGFAVQISSNDRRTIPMQGNFLFVRAASYPVRFQLRADVSNGKDGKNSDVVIMPGEKIRTITPFDSIAIENVRDEIATVNFIAGYGDIDSSRLLVSDYISSKFYTLPANSNPQLVAPANPYRTRVILSAYHGNTDEIEVAGDITEFSNENFYMEASEELIINTRGPVYAAATGSVQAEINVMQELLRL